MQNRILRQVLLRHLCNYFRLDYDEITAINSQQILYVHDWVVRTHGKTYLRDVLPEIAVLQATLEARGRRRRLEELYWRLKTESIINSGRYDTSTLKPPTKAFKNDGY